MILRIRELREAAGISQKRLAELMGVLPSVICNWESEVALPRTRQLPALAAAQGVTISELFSPESIVAHPEAEYHAS